MQHEMKSLFRLRRSVRAYLVRKHQENTLEVDGLRFVKRQRGPFQTQLCKGRPLETSGSGFGGCYLTMDKL